MLAVTAMVPEINAKKESSLKYIELNVKMNKEESHVMKKLDKNVKTFFEKICMFFL